MGENALFWADRNFWSMGQPEGPQIGRVPISAMLHTPLQGISISMKNKKVMLIESYEMPKNQKSWLPPPLALNVRIFQVCPEMDSLLCKIPKKKCNNNKKKNEIRNSQKFKKAAYFVVASFFFLFLQKFLRPEVEIRHIYSKRVFLWPERISFSNRLLFRVTPKFCK